MAKKFRISRILEEYGKFPAHMLNESIRKLMKRYGGDRTQHVMELVKNGNLDRAIELLLDYYDRNYRFGFEKYVKGKITMIKTTSADASENAGLILKTIKRISIYAGY